MRVVRGATGSTHELDGLIVEAFPVIGDIAKVEDVALIDQTVVGG